MLALRTPDACGVLRKHQSNRALLVALSVGMASMLTPQSVEAKQFTAMDGELSGSFDNTVSIGVSIRAEDADPDIIGRANGGRANSINYDNGNLNYDKGDVWSAPIKLTSELEAQYKNVGIFLRGLVFYDYAIMEGDLDRKDPITRQQKELSDSAERLAGYEWVPLDAYMTYDVELNNGMLLTLRGGNQVISWGESTFIQNGINTINPADLSRLRVAGAELREGLKPQLMLDANLSINDQVSVEGFYQLAWRHTEIEPEGTFLSVNDFAAPGGNAVFFGFGRPDVPDSPDNLFGAGRVNEALAPIGVVVRRGADRDAKDEGQFGLAMRYIEPNLNDTEFGLFWTHLHSRLPVLSAQAGSPVGLGSGDYASSANYFREFPEGLDTIGVSFNGTLPSSGVALQGELSYAIDRPLQVDEVELLFAALTPVRLAPSPAAQQLGGLVSQNGIGAFGFGEYIPGYKEHDVLQYQMTATQLLGPQLGADQVVVLGEFGVTYIEGLEDDGEPFYNGPGTYTHGNPIFTAAGLQPATEDNDGFADDFSWGYRLLSRLEYNNVIGAVGFQPTLAFSHDVDGTTPGPGGNFVEERKAITAAMGATYLNNLKMALSYSAFFGADQYNQRNDRDFVSLTASYSF